MRRLICFEKRYLSLATDLSDEQVVEAGQVQLVAEASGSFLTATRDEDCTSVHVTPRRVFVARYRCDESLH
jgi:hypothetical protein